MNEMYQKKNCPRCNNKFVYTKLMNRDVCYTCEHMNSGTFWYPILEDIGIPVPKTIFLHLDSKYRRMLSDYKKPNGIDRFLKELKTAIDIVGLPAFLRTDCHSDKHNWKNTCFIENTEEDYLMKHLFALAEFSELADIERGDPYHFWMVREMIPTEKVFTAFNEMPIVSEVRYFVRNGNIECKHHYWPREAFKREDRKIDYEKLINIPKEELEELDKMALYVSKWFSGFWSVDFLRNKDGKWYATDMALGERSYHEEHNKTT